MGKIRDIVGYVWTDESDDDNEAGRQKKVIQHYADRFKLECVIFEDQGKDRGNLNAAMKSQPGAFVTWSISRLPGALKDKGEFLITLAQQGINFMEVSNLYNSSDDIVDLICKRIDDNPHVPD